MGQPGSAYTRHPDELPGEENQEANMATSKQSAAVEDRETASLIASDKVEGTAVYDADGKRIGKIERLMIDKLTGKVAYAVTSFGGILGIGADLIRSPGRP
jgi:uncharacterized protein YrrD